MLYHLLKRLPLKCFNSNLFILALVLLSNNLEAQNFQWLKTFKFKNGVVVRSISPEPGGGAILDVTTFGDGTIYKADTIRFDTFKFISKSSNYHSTYLLRIDSSGKVINAKLAGDFRGLKMCRDKQGNVYLGGYLDEVKSTVGSVTMSRYNGTIVFAKFDKNFNFVWATQTGVGDTLAQCIYLTNSDDRIYFIVSTYQSCTIGGTSYFFGSPHSYPFGELNQINGAIKWSNYLYASNSTTRFVVSAIVNLNKKLFISGTIGGSEVVIKGDTFYKTSGYVAETDTLGNYNRRFCVKGQSYFGCMVTDGKHLYLGGHFVDTMYWGKQKISPHYAPGTNRTEIFAASISTSFKPRWFFRPKVIDFYTYLGYVNGFGNAVFDNGYLYFGGIALNKLLIDSSILSGNNKSGFPLFIKTDTLGNVLWATGGKSEGAIWCMAVLAQRSVYAGGVYWNKIEMGSFSDTSSNGYSGSGWVTRISDYYITRGKVKPGPYCAGDSIKIPFARYGRFDSTNYFIAQLSNEYGNFESGYRELGRIKSNKDTFITCRLPLFKVSSSPLYRIRILSTKPAVQSYYKTDTLRLLIYSTDKADPGPPDTICRGDTIRLNTYGGTKWTWTPTYNMNNASVRQPLVWPDKDTIYRIVIADSSGCGKPDTAFKKIFVRDNPKAIIAFNDTIVCSNYELNIPARFEYGVARGYKWKWYFVNPSGSFFPLKQGSDARFDTLIYTPSVDSKLSEKLALVLSDGCSSIKDTVYINISQRKEVMLKTTFRDTVLCSGQTIKYRALITGGSLKNLQFQWKDLITNTVLSTSDSFKFTTSKTLKIQLIVNDGCPALGDTAEFNITVKPPLKATANLRDTTICFGKTISYKAKAQGGDAKAYKFYWVLNNKLIDSTSTPTLTSTSTSTLTLILKDNCTIPNDTIKKTITIKPSPKADFTYDLACSRTITKFQFTGTKSPSPITTYFNWDFNKEATSTLENPSHKFAAAGTSTSTLILASDNGCTDTLKKIIEIKPQSKADFETSDICESDSAVFKNLSQEATGYNWKFGDGQNSKSQNPRHKFQISSTTTFNVTLVAVVTNGCSDSLTKAITVNSNPDSDFSFTTTGNKVDLRATVQGNTKYQWKFGNTDSATTTVGYFTHTIKSSDQYNVCLRVTNLAACTAQTCKNVTVGISGIAKPSGFKIYPNPNDGNFIVEIENPGKEVSVEVYDMMGRLVKMVTKVEKATFLDLEVEAGIYLVRVNNGGVFWNQRVVVGY